MTLSPAHSDLTTKEESVSTLELSAMGRHSSQRAAIDDAQRDAVALPITAQQPAGDAQHAGARSAAALRCEIGRWLAAGGIGRGEALLLGSIYAAVLLAVAVMYLGQRGANFDAFRWGHHLMNLPMAAAGLGCLLLSAIAASGAVLAAGRSRRGALAASLALAGLGGAGFVATALIDRDTKTFYGIRAGADFRPNERYVARCFGVKLPKRTALPVAAAGQAALGRKIDARFGETLFLGTCAGCHGPDARGMPGQGKPLVANTFIQGLDDAKMLAFVQVGRQPWDKLNTTKVQMPPRGGNPMLTDDDLKDIIAFLRTLQTGSAAAAPATAAGGAATTAPAGASAAAAPVTPPVLTHRWVVSPPRPSPAGLSADFFADAAQPRWAPPPRASVFASAYMSVTQFQTLQTAVVTLVLLALVVLALRGKIGPDNRAPVALAAAACWCVAGFWVVLAPFVYVM